MAAPELARAPRSRVWALVVVDFGVFAAAEYWLVGGRSDGKGWLVAGLALLGLVELLVGLRDLRREPAVRPFAAVIVGTIAAAAALWLSPSWRWLALAATTMGLIVLTSRLERLFNLRRPDESRLG